MNIEELGKQYIETAAMLRKYALKLEQANNGGSKNSRRQMAAKILEIRKKAVEVRKCGNYLVRYYERGERK